MKNNLILDLKWFFCSIVFLFYATGALRAQWIQTKGPGEGLASVLMADNNGNFLVGSRGGGIYLSTDSGQTWTQSNSGITQNSFSVNYMDTINQHIFIGGPSSYQSFVYESADHGQTWNPLILSMYNISGIEHIGSRVFVSTSSQGLYYSDNMGLSWDTLPTYTFYNSAYPTIIAINAIGNDLFASVTDSGLYKSSDLGNTWVHANGGLNGNYPPLKIVENNGILWSCIEYNNELHKSTDGGLNWTLQPIAGQINSLNDLQIINGELYVVTDPSIIKSNNNGASFTPCTGAVQTEYKQIAFNGSVFLSSTNVFSVALQRSTDNCNTWVESNEGYANSRITAVLADGNNLFTSSYDRDMFITSDFGQTYTRIPSFLNPALFCAYDIIKYNNEIIQCGYSRIWRTANNGTSWTDYNSFSIPGTWTGNQFLSDGNDLYVATSIGIFKSTNFGAWTAVNAGIPASTEFNSIVKNGNRIFICGTTSPYIAKVYSSDDNGTTWNDISATVFGIGTNSSAQKMIVSGGNILLASNGSLYRSIDNGLTWNIAGAGLPFGLLNTLFEYGTDLYASMGSWEDPNGDVLISHDNGLNWLSFKENLFNSNVTDFEVLNGDLYVSTYWGGVWKRPLSSIIVSNIEKNLEKNLMRIYPNPTNEYFTIAHNLGANTTIHIFNLMGNLIFSEVMNNANNTINTKQFTEGIYTIQLTHGTTNVVDKLVIIK